LVTARVPLDIVDRIIGLALVEGSEAVVGDLADAFGRLAGRIACGRTDPLAFP
jgi:hypothetical protein